MNFDSQKNFTTVVVDGEELYLPDTTGWDEIRKERSFRGWPIGVEELLWRWGEFFFWHPELQGGLGKAGKWVEFCSGHPELRVALGKAGKAFDLWTAYVIVCVDSRPTRIQLQTVQCPNCKWRGMGGTTAEPDLFVALGPDFHAKYVAA